MSRMWMQRAIQTFKLFGVLPIDDRKNKVLFKNAKSSVPAVQLPKPTNFSQQPLQSSYCEACQMPGLQT